MIGPQRFSPSSIHQITAQVKQVKTTLLQYALHQSDCLEILPWLGDFDCIFADPFDNINLDYDEYDDRMPDDDYLDFLEQLVNECANHAPICWFSFNAKWTFGFGRIFDSFLAKNKQWEGKACVQVFTFGQHRKTDLGNNHRPLWRLKRADAPLYPEQIKVPSWRQRNGDKRAAAGGRVPGDVLDFQYPGDFDEFKAELAKQDFAAGISAEAWPRLLNYLRETHPGDVLDFPRVTGNSKQRCDWHPTQLHEDMVKRCILLSTPEYGKVLDPFGGTGTTLRASKSVNRACTLIEKSAGYCAKIREAHPEISSS